MLPATQTFAQGNNNQPRPEQQPVIYSDRIKVAIHSKPPLILNNAERFSCSIPFIETSARGQANNPYKTQPQAQRIKIGQKIGKYRYSGTDQ